MPVAPPEPEADEPRSKKVKVDHQEVCTPGSSELKLLHDLQRKLALCKDVTPVSIPGEYQIPLQSLLKETCEVLNLLGRKLGSSDTTMGSLLKSGIEGLVEQLIELDVYFKMEHPEKLAMWMSHGWMARSKELGIRHQGGLIDVILVPNDFCLNVVRCTGDVPLSLYSAMIEHLNRYYKNLQQQPHVSLKCIAGEIMDLGKFCCSCATCKQICQFYGLQHDVARLVIDGKSTAPLGFEEVARHVFETKIAKDINLDMKDDIKPKTFATAKKKKELVFEKDGRPNDGILVLLHFLNTFKTQVQNSGAVATGGA
jgi:hypothetical protein